MSLTLPQDTSTPAPQPSLGSARQAHPDSALAPPEPQSLPWRAQFSLLHQRIILTLRFLLRPIFHLPIDDVKDQQLEARLASLLKLAKQNLETMNTLIGVSNNMQQRLLFYEANIPRMRELKREFNREQEMLRQAAERPAQEAAARAAHGIVDPPSTNGHRPLIEVVR